MTPFSSADLDEIHDLWSRLGPGHVWTGWAHPGKSDSDVWIFRTRANWRRFLLTKSDGGFQLRDEKRRVVADDETLAGLLDKVAAIPGIDTPV